MTAERRYLRAGEIVALTGLSLRTVRRRIREETWPSVRCGGARLVPASALEERLAPAPWDAEGEDEQADGGSPC